MDQTVHYDDLLRRAELYTYIAELVKGGDSLPLAELKERAPAARTAPPAREVLPRIGIMDRRVICNGASIDLARRPLTLRLFQIFLDSPGLSLSREDLTERIYRASATAGHSSRFVDSAYGNAVKLISRARILASAGFSRSAGAAVEWFVHDQERRVWCLYRLRTEYLVERLG